MQRFRIRYTKNKLLRYTGTLDMQKIWERVLRRANLPIQYSQGFHPQPKIQLACPLPLGMISSSEYIDFWLENEHSLQQLEQMITPVNHPGIEIQTVEEVPLHEPSLQSRLNAAEYKIFFLEDNTALVNSVNDLLRKENILRTRRGKQYDLRPLIEECSVSYNPAAQNTELILKLSARPGATGRPEEVLAALSMDAAGLLIERTEILFTPEE